MSKKHQPATPDPENLASVKHWDLGNSKPRTFAPLYWIVQKFLRLPLNILTKPVWSGQENLPTTGSFIAAANHTSEFDSLTYMHYLMAQGIPVRVLCKEALFRVPLWGSVMRSAKQIPVYRNSTHSGDALIAAKEALAAGECVGIFPEGTITRCPDSWPMEGKSGAARLALQCQVPVIPIVQWGAQDVMDRYCRRISLWPRKKVVVKALPEVPLADLYDRADDPQAWHLAQERIIAALTVGLEEIRGYRMLIARASDKNGDLPSKKELGWACGKWLKEHPGRLPSQRKAGELRPYLEQARIELAQEAETPGEEAEQAPRESEKPSQSDSNVNKKPTGETTQTDPEK